MELEDAQLLGEMIESCPLTGADKKQLADRAAFFWPQFRFAAEVTGPNRCDIIVDRAPDELFTCFAAVNRAFTSRHLRKKLDGIIPDKFMLMGTQSDDGERYQTVLVADKQSATKVRMLLEGEPEGVTEFREVSLEYAQSIRRRMPIPWECAR